MKPGLLCALVLLLGPLAAPAQSFHHLPPHQAGDTARSAGLTGLGPLLVVGRPLGAIIGALEAEWSTRVQVVAAVPAGRPDSVHLRILELRDAAQDPQYQLLRRCPEVRVFVLPYYPLPAADGLPAPGLRGLYLVFYQEKLTRIWSPEAVVMARLFEHAYGFGPGLGRITYGPDGSSTTRLARSYGKIRPRATVARRTWHNGDVVAGAYQLYWLREDRLEQSFLLKSRRLDAALTRCLGLAVPQP